MRNFSCLNKKKKELCVFWRITKNKNKQPKRRKFGKKRALFAKGKLLGNKNGHKKRCLLYSARLHSLLMVKKLVASSSFYVRFMLWYLVVFSKACKKLYFLHSATLTTQASMKLFYFEKTHYRTYWLTYLSFFYIFLALISAV